VVDGSRFVVGSRVVDGSWFVGRGMVVTMGAGMVSMSRGMDRDVAGGVAGGNIFLLILVLVNLIGGSSGLTVHNCVRVSTGFVD